MNWEIVCLLITCVMLLQLAFMARNRVEPKDWRNRDSNHRTN